MKQNPIPTKQLEELVIQYKANKHNREEIFEEILTLLFPKIEQLANVISKKMNNIAYPHEFISYGADNFKSCIEHYDPNNKASFLTYASNYIYPRLMLGCLQVAGITSFQRACFLKYNKAYRTLTSKLGREPTDKELMEELGCSQQRFETMRKTLERPHTTHRINEDWEWGMEGMPQTQWSYRDIEYNNLLKLMDKHLTKDQKTVLILNAGHGLGEGPISKITKLPKRAIRIHKDTAIKIMRRVLQKDLILEAKLQ